MSMFELEKVSRSTFEPLIGQTFEVVFSDGRLPLTLASVKPLGEARPGATRDPFALTFHGAPALRLPQRMYRLEHATSGGMEIFLVQTGADAATSQFEAIFN
jgi:hypothetical protein